MPGGKRRAANTLDSQLDSTASDRSESSPNKSQTYSQKTPSATNRQDKKTNKNKKSKAVEKASDPENLLPPILSPVSHVDHSSINMQVDVTPNISFSNRYAILAAFSCSDDSTTVASNTKTKIPSAQTGKTAQGQTNPDSLLNVHNTGDTNSKLIKSVKPPPLYISNFSDNIPNFERKLAKEFGKSFNIKFLGNKIRLQFDNILDYKKLKLALDEENTQYFTFSLNSERSLSMVLKGLPNIPSEEIIAEINAKGQFPTSCSTIRYKNHTGNSLYNIYRINFPTGTSPNDISKIKTLFSTRVYWEKFLSKRTYSQCYRCQAFGHTAANCRLPPNCVKCAGKHHTSDCKKDIQTAPKCVNCDGQHTANFNQCPVLLKYLNRRKNSGKPPTGVAINSVTTSQPINSKNLIPPKHPSRGLLPSAYIPSYANVAAGFLPSQLDTEPQIETTEYIPVNSNSHPNEKNLNHMTELIAAMQELNSIVSIEQMLALTRTLIEKLRPCRTLADKFQTFWAIFQNLI